MGGRVQQAIAQLQESPNSLDEIRSAILQVRLTSYNYHVLWVTYMDFLVNADTREFYKVRETEEHCMNNCKQFVDSNVAQANEQKEEIFVEMGSMHTGSHASSMLSSALWAIENRCSSRNEKIRAAEKAFFTRIRVSSKNSAARVCPS